MELFIYNSRVKREELIGIPKSFSFKAKSGVLMRVSFTQDGKREQSYRDLWNDILLSLTDGYPANYKGKEYDVVKIVIHSSHGWLEKK